MEKTLDIFEKYIFYITVFLFPLFLLPIFSNPYDLPKMALIAVGASLVILIRVIKMVSSGHFEFHTGNFDIPILILAAAYLLSGILVAPNKMEAFFLPGTSTLIVIGAIIYFLSNMVLGNNKKGLSIALLLSGIVLSTLTLLSIVGVLAKVPQLPEFMKAATFSFAGGQLASAIFLAFLIPLTVGMVIKEAEIVKKLFWAVSLLVILLGLGLSIYPLLPGKENNLVLPPYQTSWAVAVESLKQSPILGVGAGNYLSAFGQFRPLQYNATPLWTVRFPFASDFFLTILAEVGLLGLAGYILIIIAGIKSIRSKFSENPWTYLALILAFAATIAVPANLVFLMAFFIIISVASEVKRSETAVSPALIVVLPILAALSVFWFFSAKALIAEANFQKGVTALNKNDAKTTYNSIGNAINQNPYVDRYHGAFAQVNLAIAQSIAREKDLKDEDKNNITSAIQTAISEGKATVALNPQRSATWTLLAQIYQTVMPFAQGADAFAVDAYSQAVSLDPIDPNLRISLGGVYYALGRYDDAIQAFQLATFAKPDLANAHYNLSAAYREKGDVDKAISEMKVVLTLVPKNSNDATVAQNELNDLEKKSAASKTLTKEESKSGQLSAPQPAPSPAISPQISLPSEATPPAQP